MAKHLATGPTLQDGYLDGLEVQGPNHFTIHMHVALLPNEEEALDSFPIGELDSFPSVLPGFENIPKLNDLIGKDRVGIKNHKKIKKSSFKFGECNSKATADLVENMCNIKAKETLLVAQKIGFEVTNEGAVIEGLSNLVRGEMTI
ncbi:hypothetical protein REPUB_Repub15cG0148300 [Reevesia pubescens]